LVVGIKFYEDNYFENSIYAKIGGISVQEMTFLEKEFLKMIDFELLIKKCLFNDAF
jgi:hypothetical protein